jgi:hypothetical protein
METHLTDRPPVLVSITSGISKLARFCRAFRVTFYVSLIALAATPKALAAGADGTYRFTSIAGSLELVGDSVPPPLSVLEKLVGVANGNFTIRNNTLKFNRSATVDIVKSLTDDPDYTLTTKVTGPTSLVLRRSGTAYQGEFVRPIVTSFEGNFNDQDISGKLITNIAATVNGKKLKLIIKFSGNFEGGPFSGKLTLVGIR